jgi:hypothetical protein
VFYWIRAQSSRSCVPNFAMRGGLRHGALAPTPADWGKRAPQAGCEETSSRKPCGFFQNLRALSNQWSRVRDGQLLDIDLQPPRELLVTSVHRVSKPAAALLG